MISPLFLKLYFIYYLCNLLVHPIIDILLLIAVSKTPNLQIVRIKSQSIQCKRDSRFIKALDSQRNTIQVGDLVRVVDGPLEVFILLIKFLP